ncbi:MAG: hypothetical protein ACMXYL_05215 [Candidatus Woesearchaeota archaeon]
MIFKKKKKEEKKKDPIDDPVEYFGSSDKGWGWDTVRMGRGASIILKPGDPTDQLTLTPNSGYTPFPKPIAAQKLIYESEKKFVEESYYWLLHWMRYGGAGIPNVEKLIDTFSSSVQSSMFGNSEQRLAVQQDRANQYMRTISEMVKNLPQILRELRIIDERLSFYDDSFKNPDAKASDHALKGVWVDLVEGGAKNPASVYGMAQTVSFTTLPDLFFRVKINEHGMHKKKGIDYEQEASRAPQKVDEAVGNIKGFNDKVKEVLKRKLVQYYIWKYRTYLELKQRRVFMLKSLRHFYTTIKMYAEWLKPYLMNIRRLSQQQGMANSPDIISSFESAILELELFGIMDSKKTYKGCMSIHFKFVTTPALTYMTDGYQNRGPTHNGRMELTIRTYVMNDDDIKLYRRLREQQAFDLIKEHDQSIAAIIDSMGDELKEYLKEAGEDMRTDREKEIEEREKEEIIRIEGSDNPFSIFTDLWGGFKEMFGSLGVGGLFDFSGKKEALSKAQENQDKEKAKKDVLPRSGLTFKIYKKAHRFMTG